MIINDKVMSGKNRTCIDINKNVPLFSGILSLKNNGSFASIQRVYNGKAWLSDNPYK